ncbi:MAG TPA: condensation domain-containing protein, partial [Longimicrobiaceae bacterium]|nr:condensation domain-containing protein [Longimicrobiaceae bacterium]
LRARLVERLPEHMVPSAFVVLERLPLSANGKIGRRALPDPEPAPADAGHVGPRTEVEEVLCGVWAEVLRLERVGVHDGFFELGGDSILSLQVVARARRRGLRLTPRQLFERPTVARLAAVVERADAEAAAAAQDLVTGEAPLTPIQRWFFARDLPAPHHFNQALLLEPRQPLGAELAARAVAALEAHHDALRLRFRRDRDGWTQVHASVGEHAPLAVADLSGLAEDARGGALAAAAERVQRSLELEHGPLLRVVLFTPGAGAQRLLLVIHHLVIDGVSWRILLEDLETAYAQLERGEAVRLPRKTTSWKEWAQGLERQAGSWALQEEAGYWREQAGREVAPLPMDDPAGENTVARARSVAVRLSEEETEALLREVPAAYRTQIDDVLLTALARALARWTGERRVRVDLEGHGREEEVVGGVDLSRTVGWFTSVYPVLLELPRGGGTGEALKAVKEQLRGVPGKGIGHGMLRYLSGTEAGADLARAPEAKVAFNYLGQFDQTVSPDAFFCFAEGSGGVGQDEHSTRRHRLEVHGSVRGGRLEVEIGYSEGVHRAETMERLAGWLAEELRALVSHCRSAEAGGYTPSDVALSGLDPEALDALLGRMRGVEDVDPLTPMQEGMLFHAL